MIGLYIDIDPGDRYIDCDDRYILIFAVTNFLVKTAKIYTRETFILFVRKVIDKPRKIVPVGQ